ncbi:MAG: hypothetical protein L6R19_15130 [Alphaproteobacteria bacterium]|nr:hypothetical protein [Alphaproteobacteria bacterium]
MHLGDQAMFTIAGRYRPFNPVDLTRRTAPTVLGGMVVWSFCLLLML